MVVTLWDHMLMIVFGIVFPFYSVLSSRRPLTSIHFDYSLKKNLYYSNSLILWAAAAVVSLLWWTQNRPFSMLGFWYPTWERIPVILCFLVIILYLIDVFLEVKIAVRRDKTIQRWKKYTPFLPENNREFTHFIFLAFSAGICEEIVFRGYFITYLINILGDTTLMAWAAITLPAIVFGVAHLYQGATAVLKIIFMALLFGWIFVLIQSLFIVIILHILIDLVGGWLAVKLLGSTALFDEEE